MDKTKFIFALTFAACLVFVLGSIRLTASSSVETAVVIAGEADINNPNDVMGLALTGYAPYGTQK